MTTAQELDRQFTACRPLFIALGDEVRLTIVRALVEDAFARSPYAHESGLSAGRIYVTFRSSPCITQNFPDILSL